MPGGSMLAGGSRSSALVPQGHMRGVEAEDEMRSFWAPSLRLDVASVPVNREGFVHRRFQESDRWMPAHGAPVQARLRAPSYALASRPSTQGARASLRRESDGASLSQRAARTPDGRQTSIRAEPVGSVSSVQRSPQLPAATHSWIPLLRQLLHGNCRSHLRSVNTCPQESGTQGAQTHTHTHFHFMRRHSRQLTMGWLRLPPLPARVDLPDVELEPVCADDVR